MGIDDFKNFAVNAGKTGAFGVPGFIAAKLLENKTKTAKKSGNKWSVGNEQKKYVSCKEAAKNVKGVKCESKNGVDMTLKLKNGNDIKFEVKHKKPTGNYVDGWMPGVPSSVVGTVYDKKGKKIGEVDTKIVGKEFEVNLKDVEKYNDLKAWYDKKIKNVKKDADNYKTKIYGQVNFGSNYRALKKYIDKYEGDPALIKAFYDELGPDISQKVIYNACLGNAKGSVDMAKKYCEVYGLSFSKEDFRAQSGYDADKIRKEMSFAKLKDRLKGIDPRNEKDVKLLKDIIKNDLSLYNQVKFGKGYKECSSLAGDKLVESVLNDKLKISDMTELVKICPHTFNGERLGKLMTYAIQTDGSLGGDKNAGEEFGIMVQSYLSTVNPDSEKEIKTALKGLFNGVVKKFDQVKKDKEYVGHICGVIFGGMSRHLSDLESQEIDTKKWRNVFANATSIGLAGYAATIPVVGPVLSAAILIAGAVITGMPDGGKEENSSDFVRRWTYKINADWTSEKNYKAKYKFPSKSAAENAADNFEKTFGMIY